MKKLVFLIFAALALGAAVPVFNAGCQAPSTRVAQVTTLKIVGQTAEAAVAASAQLWQSKTITAEQANRVKDLYDKQFQPAFTIAVTAVNSNLDSVASPELAALALQLSSLVLQFQTQKQ